jgi:hypothetical protein
MLYNVQENQLKIPCILCCTKMIKSDRFEYFEILHYSDFQVSDFIIFAQANLALKKDLHFGTE